MRNIFVAFTLTTITSLAAEAGFRLVKGGESIHALYQKDENEPSISTTDQYYKILTYLCFVELGRVSRLLPLARKVRRLGMRVIRHVLGNSLVDSVKGGLGWL